MFANVIRIITQDPAVDFAASELKKYIRMLMPEEKDAAIRYGEGGDVCYRLGVFGDLGVRVEEPYDPALDDVILINTNGKGGVIAGSNPRSVLFAVYKFLYFNGCRWLYPGVDGEYIPVVGALKPVTYFKKADFRYRGQCNEGCESQQAMLDTIDYSAKLGMNVYMMEFRNPFTYYDRYYSHVKNEANRPPEPITEVTALQYKRQCEAEIAKRGLQFHDVGHGWTAEPFGFSCKDGWGTTTQQTGENPNFRFLAQVNGKRELHGGVALNTNICMSNPEAREIIASSVAEYAEDHENADYIHVWLADDANNHCECENCRKKRTSDWYMILLNEIDRKLTARGLKTRIVFIVYVDTLWKPLTEKLNNPERFTMLFAPITRTYMESYPAKTSTEPAPYELNRLKFPKKMDEITAYLKDWQTAFSGPRFTYEYHFHLQQYYDPAFRYIPRRIYEDVRAIRQYGLDGIVEDASQRSFFPNGFAMYVYAATLFDRSLTFESIEEDYFSHAYGPAAGEAKTYFREMGELLDYPFLSGNRSQAPGVSRYYLPAKAEELERVAEVIARAEKTFRPDAQFEARVWKVSCNLLRRHFEYCRGIAAFMKIKATGKFEEAKEAAMEVYNAFGKHEVEIERYYDHGLAVMAFNRIVKEKKKESETQFT